MDTVKDFLNAGGTISYPYKKKMDSWVEDVRLTGNDHAYYVILSQDIDMPQFKTFEEAFDVFKDKYLSYKSIWFVLRSLERKGLYDLENLERDIDRKTGKICNDEDGRKLAELIKAEKEILKNNNNLS